MMLVKPSKKKTKNKKRKRKLQENHHPVKIKKVQKEINQQKVPSSQELQKRLHKLQSFNIEANTNLNNKNNQTEAKYDETKQLSECALNNYCTELIWCEVSNQNQRYLNFKKLYDKTPKDATSITLNDLFKNTMLKYIDKSHFNEKYKYKNIQNDVGAFCVLLWTSSDCHQYKKIPKCVDKLKTNSFQIYKYLQNCLIYDDKTGLELSMLIIRCINNVINNYPTEKQLIGYRGSKMNAKEFNKFELNEERRIAMYVPCSMNKTIAKMFIGRGNVLITIVIPKGCLNAAVIPNPMSMFPNEKEILIPPYSVFTCIGKKESVQNNQIFRQLVLRLTMDNKCQKFDGLKNVPYWTA
eukprot:304617_1